MGYLTMELSESSPSLLFEQYSSEEENPPPALM